VRAHGLDADRELVRDLAVRAAALKQLEHVRLTLGQDVRLPHVEARLARGRRSRRAGHHVHPARREVEGVDDVAALGLLGDARSRPERHELIALGGGRPVREHDDARVRRGLVQLVDERGRRQRAVVQQYHRRLQVQDDRFESLERHVVADELDVGILGDYLAQADRDEVLEGRRDDGDGGGSHMRGG
jgi:hypothetical protein